MFYLAKSHQFVHCNANTLKTDPGSGEGGGLSIKSTGSTSRKF